LRSKSCHSQEGQITKLLSVALYPFYKSHQDL
jgi:hypothetical protein